jgi:5-methylcytosine-specific restriction endonuclease McrA
VTWEKTPESRRRDNEVYGDPEYRKNRAIARRRAAGRCAQCGHGHPRLECDHIVPKIRGGGNALPNLQMLCAGEGSCKCHEAKTYEQRGNSQAGKRAADPEPRPDVWW